MEKVMEDKIKMWKGFSKLGFWSEVYITITGTTIQCSHKQNKKPFFRVHIKMVEVKDKKEEKFSMNIGTKHYHFKTDSKIIKQKWLRSI